MPVIDELVARVGFQIKGLGDLKKAQAEFAAFKKSLSGLD